MLSILQNNYCHSAEAVEAASGAASVTVVTAGPLQRLILLLQFIYGQFIYGQCIYMDRLYYGQFIYGQFIYGQFIYIYIFFFYNIY